MRRFAQFALASAAVLVIVGAEARAAELYGPVPHARAAAKSLPRIVYGPALPQYPVRPYYLVDQGPSDDVPTNPYGIPESYYAPRPAYGYVDTDDYYGADLGYDGYGGYYGFAPAFRHFHHRRSHESGVSVYRGPSATHWGMYRQAALHGDVARSHAAHHGLHRMPGHAGSARIPMHARPAMRAPMRQR